MSISRTLRDPAAVDHRLVLMPSAPPRLVDGLVMVLPVLRDGGIRLHFHTAGISIPTIQAHLEQNLRSPGDPWVESVRSVDSYQVVELVRPRYDLDYATILTLKRAIELIKGLEKVAGLTVVGLLRNQSLVPVRRTLTRGDSGPVVLLRFPSSLRFTGGDSHAEAVLLQALHTVLALRVVIQRGELPTLSIMLAPEAAQSWDATASYTAIIFKALSALGTVIGSKYPRPVVCLENLAEGPSIITSG